LRVALTLASPLHVELHPEKSVQAVTFLMGDVAALVKDLMPSSASSATPTSQAAVPPSNSTQINVRDVFSVAPIVVDAPLSCLWIGV
jgi:hypothetical protein